MEDVNGMDKFGDETGERLNEIAMDGFLDDQFGSVTEDGLWLGLILEHKAIIQEDDQGFFDYEIYDTEAETQKAFDFKRGEYIMGFSGDNAIPSELVLLAENDYELYKARVEPITKNLERKLAKGIFDSAKAAKLVKSLMDDVAKKYAKHYGDTFTPDDRRLAAQLWVEQFLINRGVTA